MVQLGDNADLVIIISIMNRLKTSENQTLIYIT